VQVVGTPAPADGAPVAPLDPPPATGSGEGSVPSASTQNPAQQSAQSQTPRSASQPTRPTGTGDTRAATPSAPNGAGTAALAEQLVPMSTPSAPAPGESSGDEQ
ncbi:MAG: hypothetical protein JHD12_06455, partial [Rhodococcus sp.]|jgi:hypothetical protein|nr:hypothetical protein [Rhodococcus sp. (in: high G+C Gram-positive bacteria)]